MNGLLKHWPIFSAAVIVAFGLGVGQAQINAVANDLEKHAKRAAHDEAVKTLTRLQAASDRIDERTSLMLKQQDRQQDEAINQRKLLQRILENQVR